MKTSILAAALASACACAVPAGPPWPRVQLVPQPGDEISFQVDGVERLRTHHGARLPRPFVYPVIGPSGAPLTRIGHPRDPHSHNHHLSLWVGHQSVGGLNFWELRPGSPGIIPDRIVSLEDGDTGRLVVRATWPGKDGSPMLRDERTWTLIPGRDGEFALDLDLVLSAAAAPVVIGKSHFGLVAVRVAKLMGTNDGGGTITNSEGRVNEAQLMPHRRARWCDYSGRSTASTVEGITLMDHPSNPNHPTYFHVRGDGWMGSSFSEEEDVTVEKERPLRFRYRFRIHRGPADPAAIDAEWSAWAAR